ncbi:hypothetical protein M0R45_036621 [Rubus argutus]|uniref:Uncharacterized protein n=1 Tax=Rubus argutus TaxID=59490 RepID=A0AAW1VZD4_RUBAR
MALLLFIFPPVTLGNLGTLDDWDDWDDWGDMDDLWFGVSAIFYAFLDPLFMYVPFINEETKCVMLDNRLKIAAIILRLFGDLRYVVRIIYRIKEGRQKYNYLKRNRIGGTKDDQQYSDFLKKIVMSVANDAVCILPVPQVVILIFLPKMRGLSSLKIMKICLPCSKKKPKDTLNDKKLPTNIPKWFGIAINIVGYILASHVLGAFWYFFSRSNER